MSSNQQDLVVGFDMDGVIIDHAPNKLALAESYAVHLKPEETHPDLLLQKFAREEYHAYLNELYGGSEFALSAPLMAGAHAVLRELKEHNIPFVLISRRGEAKNAVSLLDRRGLWGELFDEQNSFFVHTPEEKNIISTREGVTHFFDDERHVLHAIPDVRKRYLFDAFQQFTDEKEFERVYDWDMIRRVLLAAQEGV